MDIFSGRRMEIYNDEFNRQAKIFGHKITVSVLKNEKY